MERYGRLPDMDRSFDIAYWQRLGPAQYSRLPGKWSSMHTQSHPAVPMSSDFEELLRVFNGNEVKFGGAG